VGRTPIFLVLSLAVVCLGFFGRMAYEEVRAPKSAEAQDTGTCPDAQLIDTFEGNGDQQTDTFDTTTNSFRVSYEVTGSDPEFPASLFIDVIDANDPDQFPVADATQDGDGSGETFVNSPAGTYFLDISFFGGEYTITVEQCEGGDPSINPGGGSAPASPAPDPEASPAPAPDPQRPGDRDTMLESGGPRHGPVLTLPNGKCLPEYPVKRRGYCYTR
jgi:hypothetical protein